MNEIDDALVQLEQDDEHIEMTVSHLLELASKADGLLKSSKPSIKNQILRLLVSNLEIKEKRLHFTLLEPFSLLLNHTDCPTWLRRPDSNRRPIG